jgi:hypothetical protein
MNGVKITLLFFSVFISTFNADENEETTVGERLHPFPAGAPFDRSIIVSRNVANVSPSLDALRDIAKRGLKNGMLDARAHTPGARY